MDVSRLDLRVGLITKAAKHPNADSLYVEDIDCGEDAPRVVVSGLVNHVPEAEMQNRLVVVVANLKPTNLKSVKSHAMVLAATGPDGKVRPAHLRLRVAGPLLASSRSCRVRTTDDESRALRPPCAPGIVRCWIAQGCGARCGCFGVAFVCSEQRGHAAQVELVDPPAGSKAGERVSVAGFAGEPDRQLNPKHKIFEAVHPDFSTDAGRVACYRGTPLATAGGPCTVKSVVGATIK